MKNSRLVQILRSCSKKEFRELKKWVNSPAHNQREDVILLFNYLIEDNYLGKDEFLAKEQIFKWVYPKTPFNDAKMRQTIFFFMKCLEEFLIFQEVKNDSTKSKLTLASVYRKRKLDKSFQKNIKLVHNIQNQHTFRNSEYLQNEYFIQLELYAYSSTIKRINLNLQEVSDTLDITFIADKMLQSCLMLTHQTVYKNDYKISLENEILQFIDTNPNLLDIPAIAIYYYGYRTITEKENANHFHNLKNQINAHEHLFPKFELRNIYLMAINYCIGKMNAGHDNYIREAFNFYKKGLDNKILLDNNLISRWTFLNAVVNALKLKEFGWVSNFIEEYKKYIEPQYRESIMYYSLARLHFEQKDYDKAMTYNRQIEHVDILINLNAKTMMLKMYYELEEYDALESLLESTRNYLVRKKVIGYHKSNYKNIIRFTKKLLKVNPYSRAEKEKLKNAMNQAKPLTEKNWLLKQLEKL